MHATFRRYEGIAQSTEETLRTGRQLVLALAKVPGFVSYALLDTGDGVLASVSISETQAGLVEADRVLLSWESESLIIAAAQRPAVTTGEVIMQLGL